VLKVNRADNRYRALVSTDWNECLAPCGPFDCFSHAHPEFGLKFDEFFRSYTGNRISLGETARRIRDLVPEPFTEQRMDAYLAREFTTYGNVPDLMEWCRKRQVLVMINTTGFVGYFQRVFARRLLPAVPVISAHPMIHFKTRPTDPSWMLELEETVDKGTNTETVARHFGIPTDRIIVMGDSGGDGPHFRWGASAGALLIGSMIKPSLDNFCNREGIRIGHRFGSVYEPGEPNDPVRDMQFDFMELTGVIGDFLGL
jgi:hypothetical protein